MPKITKATYRHYVRLVRGFNTFTQLMQCDCINGYGVGLKNKDGKYTKNVAVTVWVNKKLGLRRLPLSNRIPETLRLPAEDGGVIEFMTDVQEARFSSLQNVSRMRPAPSGISIGHVNITAGTLGGLVRDKANGNVVILSNNHVLADSNEGVTGDAILQPGPADGGTDPADRIATLERFVPISFAQGAQNRVDGAIARPLNPGDVVWNTLDIGPETPRILRVIGSGDLGEPVKKTGRTTEHTTGLIQSLFATVQVKYDVFQKATFVDQIIVSQDPSDPDFSNGGDSGSLVYDSANRVIGLLFAGSEGSDTDPATTIINPIQFVVNELNIELLASGDHPTAFARPAKKTAKRRKAATKRGVKKRRSRGRRR